jgi:hypothetical protein
MIMSNFLFFITVLTLTNFSGCSAKNREVSQNQSAPVPQYIKSLDSNNGQIFVKEDGWQIPGLASARKLESYPRQVFTDGGKKITVGITDYAPQIEETEEPFKSIGKGLGLISIYALKEFAIGEQRFCYKVQAKRVGSGSLFPFVYYDENGDGRFETLILDEKDDVDIDGKRKMQVISFFTMPHIPERLQIIK